MFNKFIEGSRLLYHTPPEPEYTPMLYPMSYSDFNRLHQRYVPTYYNNYCRMSKYIDNEGYIVTYSRLGLLNDIRACNAQLRSMSIRQIMDKHPIAHLEHTPDGIKMTIMTDS